MVTRKRRSEQIKRQAYLGSALDDADESLRQAREKLWQAWSQHPWNWLTGRDTDGRPLIWTKDESDEIQPIKPFPERDHLYEISNVIAKPKDYPLVFLNKPRQIMASWTVLLCVDWMCRFIPSRLWLLSKSTEEEAKVMLADKIQHVHSHLPVWVQEKSPLHPRPAHRYKYPGSGSQIWAVAENAADREFRGNTASGIVIDEAAFQEHFREMVAAAIPMNGRIIALTTPNVGTQGAIYSKEIIGIL